MKENFEISGEDISAIYGCVKSIAGMFMERDFKHSEERISVIRKETEIMREEYEALNKELQDLRYENSKLSIEADELRKSMFVKETDYRYEVDRLTNKLNNYKSTVKAE